MGLDLIRSVNGKLLRCGYTTGSCATAATKAAAYMLLSGKETLTVNIDTPKGVPLKLDVLETERGEGHVSCAIRKDSGDDPDITNGSLIYSKVSLCPEGLHFFAGRGVGTVTKPGLDQPVGEPAINSTPRRMMARELEEVSRELGYTGGFNIEISIPAGEQLAKRTFNPRIGIVGGISVIGTSGIVEPMSNLALVDTVRLELRQHASNGETDLLLVPGNYGGDFASGKLCLSTRNQVTCSNFIADGIDSAVEYGFRRILLVGHIGKLVKLGIHLANTHSSFGDGRMETLCACALLCGADGDTGRAVLDCVSTDAALDILAEKGLKKPVLELLGKRIQASLERRVPDNVTIGFVCFTNANDGEILCTSENSEELINIWR